MYYALVFYPVFDPVTAEEIEKIRQDHDPTEHVIPPHVTIVFPVPESVGLSELSQHVESVLADWRAFDVRFDGLTKSEDHWLFLLLDEGDEEVRRLYLELYTGLLAEYRRDDIEFVPHLGLGLFLKEGVRYDWDHPRGVDFDELRYQTMRQQTDAVTLGGSCIVDRLHLVAIPDEVLGWATGDRNDIPASVKVANVRAFKLRC